MRDVRKKLQPFDHIRTCGVLDLLMTDLRTDSLVQYANGEHSAVRFKADELPVRYVIPTVLKEIKGMM